MRALLLSACFLAAGAVRADDGPRRPVLFVRDDMLEQLRERVASGEERVPHAPPCALICPIPVRGALAPTL